MDRFFGVFHANNGIEVDIGCRENELAHPLVATFFFEIIVVVIIGMVGWDEGRFGFEEILRKSKIFVCESVIFSQTTQTTIVLLITH